MQVYEGNKVQIRAAFEEKEDFHAEERLLFDNNNKNSNTITSYHIRKERKKDTCSKINGL